MFDTRSANLALRSVDIVKGMIEHVAVSLQDTDLVLPLDFDDLSRDLAAPVSRPRPSSPNGSGAAAVSRRSNAPASRRSFRPHSHHPPATDVAWRTRRPGGPSSLVNPTGGAVSLDAATRRAHSTDASVRVRTDLLDRLMDMVGELVVAQAAVSEDPSLAGASMPRLRTKVSHSEKIVRELQRLSLALRMVPIKGTFQKMVRVVRDIAQRTGKSAMLLTTGDETEVDRTIVDAIADPLLHMVRNAVDHGIEAPHDRIALGKPSCGTVTLRAYAAGDSVVVELRDDGRGLNRQKLVARAVERGLIRDDAQMSDSDVYGLIFAPGFSTADTVTDVSGRGVGMDVVKQAIEGLNGRVEILSVEGQGTVFRVHLPLTLAVTDGVLVRVGKERFIIPTHGIETSFRPEASQLCTLPEGEALRVREAQIPMFRLSQLFGVRSATLNPCEGLALILSDREGRVALLVDALLGKQQAITRGLGAGIGKVPGILGGAILGDGRVSLIIDTSGLIALARSENSPSRTAA